MIAEIAQRRLANQLITRATRRSAVEIVRWFGAVQAQEYGPAKWALGLRAREGTTDAGVQKALDDGLILRTHAMRPTWHFFAAEDARWLLELTAPQVRKRMNVYDRRIGLDTPAMQRGTKVIERALRDRQYLTRVELRERLARAGMPLDPIRTAHLALWAELERVICSGPRRGKQATYALLEERVPATPKLSRDEAIAELAQRFFQSHGPATIRDFVWWSGLSTPDARRAIEIIEARPDEIDGLTYFAVGARHASPLRKRAQPTAGARPAAPARVHLLPIYDEYLVAYRDRVAVPHASGAMMSFRPREPSVFQHALVIDGQVAGTWRVSERANAVTINVVPLRRMTARDRRELHDAAARYGRFVGSPVALSVRT